MAMLGCTSENDFENGKRQLENMGYHDVKNTGYSIWCCGEGDQFREGFTAKTKEGETVTGCMCSGFLKGVTIRF